MSSAAPALPPATRWLLAFQACNSANFTIALGAPMVLTARFLGASEFQVGLLTAIPPTTLMLQLFMTSTIERVGYREAMLMGWGARSFALLLIAPLPFLVGSVSSGWLVFWTFVALLAFNIIRGLASGAWLPWLQALLPAELRGLYLGHEQRILNLSGFVTLVGCSFFLRSDPAPWKYSAMLIVSWIVGMMSVVFLRQAPARGPSGAEARRRSLPEVLRVAAVVWGHAPFRRVTRFVAVQSFALSAAPVYLVLYVHEELKWSESAVLGLQACTTLGVLLTSVAWGRLSDRAGSRPLLRLALWGQVVALGWWTAAALGWMAPGLVPAAAVYAFWGMTAAMQVVAQTRLVLGSTPPGESTIGMGVYQLVVSASMASAPVFWGGLLDYLRAHPVPGLEGHAAPFVVLFGGALALGLGAHLFLEAVKEERAIGTGRLVLTTLLDWPGRALSAIWVGRDRGES